MSFRLFHIALFTRCLWVPAHRDRPDGETAELEEYYPFGPGDADPVVIWHEGPERTNVYNLLSKEFNKSVYSPESASDPAATATVDSGLVNLQENQSLPDCLNLNSPSMPFRQ